MLRIVRAKEKSVATATPRLPYSPNQRFGMSRRALRRNLSGWLFASPWILGFVLWTVGPMIASLFIAFTEWDLITSPRWVGFANITLMFDDRLVGEALKVTTIYALVSVPLHLAVGLILAVMLNSRIGGLRFYRTAFYMPSILSGVAVALLWRWLFSTEFGLFNAILANFGINGPSWLGDPAWALPSLIIMSVWGVGAGVIIYLAGLQGIPTDLYEAAQVDGATNWHRFWFVTLPMMTPILFFQLVTGLIAALQVFTQAFIMTRGGPNNSTLFFLLYLYRNAFEYFRMGYASALAWVLFIYILALTLILFRLSDLWVYYEGDDQKE
jgi:multiple sugar transport system permease protein